MLYTLLHPGRKSFRKVKRFWWYMLVGCLFLCIIGGSSVDSYQTGEKKVVESYEENEEQIVESVQKNEEIIVELDQKNGLPSREVCLFYPVNIISTCYPFFLFCVLYIMTKFLKPKIAFFFHVLSLFF